MKYNKPISKEQFNKYINLPLDEKIKISKEIVVEFMENINRDNDEKVYIACSFGKDSIVLVDIVRSLYPELPLLFMNTGLEYRGVVELSKKYDNVIELQPTKPMEEILEEEGYLIPMGKAKSRAIRQSRKHIAEGRWESQAMRRLRGEMGEKSLFNCHTVRDHIVAPFPISEKCSHWLKDKSNREFRKKHNYQYFFTGLTYDESFMRRATIIRDGFNIMKEKSRPLGHWDSSNVLEYILKNNLEYADCYGDIVKNEKGRYVTTLYDRTGCYCCPAGSHLKSPNQYQLLYDYDREAWEHSIYDLGWKKILDYFNIPYLPERVVKEEDKDKQQKLL